MQRTGPTKASTRVLATQLDKQAKASKSGLYSVLTELLNGSTRTRSEVNVEHLNKMGARFKDKVFIVPGKVLAKGDVTMPLQVVAFQFSATAKQKITAAKGKIWTLDQLIESKILPKNMVLVK